MAQAPPQYAYAPPAPELPYYNGLFSAADKQSTGYLSGPSAVEFLSLSKLPVDLLKTIWTMADNPASNTLDANKFYVAVRLIQLFQNGKKPVDLALNVGEGEPPMRAPFFEGVNVQQIMAAAAAQAQQQQQQGGQPPAQQQQVQQEIPQPSPPMQPQLAPQTAPAMSPQRSPQQMMQQQVQQPTPQQLQQLQQPPLQQQQGPPPTQQQQQQPTMMNGAASTTLAVQDPYSMTPQELSRYETLFPQYAQPDDANNPASPRFVHGAAAVELFSKSGMDREALKTIWTMVDDPIDNKLDPIEFGVAMHLIVCITKKGLPIPGGLPASLGRVVAEARARQQQAAAPPPQQQQGMGGGMSVVGGGAPPSPGRMPSPDKMGMQQQPQQMNGGMTQMTGLGGLTPGMSQMGGMQAHLQQPPQMAEVPQQQEVGGQTVDDAFAGLSNEPVPSVDEYSAVGGMGGPDADGGMSTIGGGVADGGASVLGGGMSTMGGFGGGQGGAMSTMGGWQQPTVEVASPEPTPTPVAPVVQAQTAMPPPPLQQQQMQMQQQQALEQQQAMQQQQQALEQQQAMQQQQQALQQQQAMQQQQQAALPPRSPRAVRHIPTSPARSVGKSLPASAESTAELAELREAHQKLQAEVISLRAKAASVSEDEQETQKEIAQVASEIGKLSLELSELQEIVVEAKVTLTENLGALKVQMEKKESLEAQVADARETHEALTTANAAVEEANEMAMANQAQAVAAAAFAKEEASVAPVAAPVPPPAAPVVETADLFSWDTVVNPPPAPSAEPVAALAPEADPLMSAWGADAPSVQSSLVHDQNPSNPSLVDAGVQQQPVQQQPPAPASWGAPDAASVYSHMGGGGVSAPDAASVYSHMGGGGVPAPASWGAPDAASVHSNMGGGGVPPAEVGTRERGSVISDMGMGGAPAVNPNPYGGAGMGMGGLDFMGAGAMGGAPPQQQQAMTPMGGAMHGHGGFDDQSAAASVQGSVAPTPTSVATTSDRSFSNGPVAQTPTHAPQPAAVGPPSPSKSQLTAIKGETVKAEKGYRSCADLVRSISTEVVKLQSVASIAEKEMQALEAKTKKGSFGGKKKKAKKEYEKASDLAKQERTKVQEAKEQLAAAEREAEKAKNRMEEMREKMEQMEVEIATAASYASVQQSNSMSTEQSSVTGGYPAANQYSDPFGGGMMNHDGPPAAAPSASDPYAMGGGGGDYANPFAI